MTTGLTALAVMAGGTGIWAAAADTTDPARPNVRVEAEQANERPAEATEKPHGLVGGAVVEGALRVSEPADGSAPTTQPTSPSASAENAEGARNTIEAPVNDDELTEVIGAAFEVTVGGELLSDPELEKAVEIDLPSVATGPIRAELEAELLEVQSHGWTREGSPAFSEIEVLDGQSEDGKQMVVSACVDWSAVTYTELDGSPVPANPTPRARNIFTLVLGDDGHWVVYDREFPENPHC